MSRKYKFNNPTAAYFVSFATVYWIDVFTRQTYFHVVEKVLIIVEKKKEWRYLLIVLCLAIFT